MTPKQPKSRPSSLGRTPPPRATAKIQWIATYYKDAAGEAPARGAMRAVGFPKNVRLALEARIKAVRDAPPPSFPAGSPVWSAMSKDKVRWGKIRWSWRPDLADARNRPYRFRFEIPGHGTSTTAHLDVVDATE